MCIDIYNTTPLGVPLRPFLRAALAKRWKVQFCKGLHKFNNVDKKTTYFNENCCIIYVYIYICVYIYTYTCMYMYIQYMYIQLFRCFLSSVLPLRSVGRSNFDKGRHNSNNYVDSKSAYN